MSRRGREHAAAEEPARSGWGSGRSEPALARAREEIALSSGTVRLLFAAWGALALAVLFLRPAWPLLARFLPPCTFREVTGIPCPTCGTARSALSLLEGRFLAAFGWNPLAALTGGIFLLGGPIAAVWAVVGRKLPGGRFRIGRGAVLALVLLLLANWIYLLLAGV